MDSLVYLFAALVVIGVISALARACVRMIIGAAKIGMVILLALALKGCASLHEGESASRNSLSALTMFK